MKAFPSEVVYFNNGEIYKAPTPMELFENYVANDSADPVFQLVKTTDKKYFVTSAFKEFFGDVGPENISMDAYDCCPAVDLWCGVGTIDLADTQNCDLFFAVNSTSQLHQVAQYYGLAYPVTDAVGSIIDAAPETICWKRVEARPIVLGAIKYIAGRATYLKLYVYPKAHKDWDVWMYGASYYDHGKCWESGAVFQKYSGGVDIPVAQMRGKNGYQKAELILSEREDGVTTSYQYTRGLEDRDPAIFWKGIEFSSGQAGKVKRYESSLTVRKALYRMKSGTTLEGKDLCPAVALWLGRSYYEDSTEEELLFCVQSREMLDQVAEYYSLTIPYDEEQKAILDTNLQLYRARHYDLLGLGEGYHVPVVVGSILLKNGQPEKLLLYTFLRQWELEDQIALPRVARLLP
jgi:hypothetical protein